jgi:hypothetical protein
MEPKSLFSAKYWTGSGQYRVHHRQLYSYIARFTKVMESNNSWDASTRYPGPLARCFFLLHTYQLYKMEPRNIFCCQILDWFWPIHHGQLLYSYIARSSGIFLQPNNSQGTSTRYLGLLAGWHILPHPCR